MKKDNENCCAKTACCATRNRKVGNICDVKATCGFILVEMLTPEESMGTRLELSNAKSVPNQAYVLDVGPAVKVEDYGIRVGNRVLLQGTFVPVPRIPGTSGRELAIVDPSTVKCIFVEE